MRQYAAPDRDTSNSNLLVPSFVQQSLLIQVNFLSYYFAESGLYEMLQEYMVENENLRAENSEMHSNRDRIRREQQLLYRENERLMKRVEEMEK